MRSVRLSPCATEHSSLPALLGSLRAQTLEPDRYEVIIVDNASTDDTAEIAQAFGAQVVHEPLPNRSRARNRGVAAASARLYAFTDADCIADSGWLKNLLANASEAPLIAGEVKLRTGANPNVIERFESLWRFGQEWWVQQGWAATANLLVHAEVFDAVGGFDPSWRHIGEDVDFCFRARRAGYSLAYSPAAVVEHEGECDLVPFLRRCFRHGYSVNQTYYRLGIGYRAWRRPGPALLGDAALREHRALPRPL